MTLRTLLLIVGLVNVCFVFVKIHQHTSLVQLKYLKQRLEKKRSKLLVTLENLQAEGALKLSLEKTYDAYQDSLKPIKLTHIFAIEPDRTLTTTRTV